MDVRVPAYAASVIGRLEEAGWETYAVGGCVRDSLLGIEPHDWDLCTAARPEEVEAAFPGSRVLETGLKHGTVTILTDGGPLEITTFRTEGAYSDARHPDAVTFVRSLREDLARRDFTVNAMAYSPLRGLSDPFGGREDLQNGILRCVGVPEERFREDALRILRALRFASRFAMTIEPGTAAALRAERERLAAVSAERIFSELKGILCGQGAGKMLREFPEVFFTVLPELAPMFGFDQHMPHHHPFDVWGHTAAAVDAVSPDPVLRLTMLFHDCGKPETFTLDPETGFGHFYGHPEAGARITDRTLRALRCDNLTRETVTTLVARHDFRAQGSKKAVRRLLAEIGEENVRRLCLHVIPADAAAHTAATGQRMLGRAEELRVLMEELLAENAALHTEDLAVRGRDLLELGVPAGPRVGELMKALLNEVLDDTLPNEKAALLARAAALITEKEENT